MEIVKLASAKKTIEEVTPSGENVQIIKTADEFNSVIGKYVDPTILGSVDFDAGQIMLIYDGTVNSCVAHFEFKRVISVENETDSVKVILGYVLNPDDNNNCSPSITNPFSIYYIKTRKPISYDHKKE